MTELAPKQPAIDPVGNEPSVTNQAGLSGSPSQGLAPQGANVATKATNESALSGSPSAVVVAEGDAAVTSVGSVANPVAVSGPPTAAPTSEAAVGAETDIASTNTATASGPPTGTTVGDRAGVVGAIVNPTSPSGPPESPGADGGSIHPSDFVVNPSDHAESPGHTTTQRYAPRAKRAARNR